MVLALCLGGAVEVAAYADRVERRRDELLLPDDYLDPMWSPPPVVEPLPPLPGENDSATSDPLDAAEDAIDAPFEDIGEHFGDDYLMDDFDEGAEQAPLILEE